LLRLWRNLFRHPSEATHVGNPGHQDGRRGTPGMFVRLIDGSRVEVPDAEYAMTVEGGRVVFLDGNRQVLREFPWVDVVAYGRRR